MSTYESATNEADVQGGTKKNAINVALLSVAFGINFFGRGCWNLFIIGTNAFMNFAVPILGIYYLL